MTSEQEGGQKDWKGLIVFFFEVDAKSIKKLLFYFSVFYGVLVQSCFGGWFLYRRP